MTLEARRDLLAAVLDTLIPAGDGFPRAGEAALAHVLAASSASPALAAVLSRGLDAVTEQTRAAGSFASLPPGDREEALRRVEQSAPEVFQALLRHAYEAYYSHPAVLTRLGVDPRPPQPHGHRMEDAPGPDLSRVTARGPLYRRA